LDLASHRQGKPVRPVWQTVRPVLSRNSQKPFREKTCLKNLSSFEQEHPQHDRNFLAQKLFTTAHRAKPVRPVWETGQTGFGLDNREELNPREKLKPSSD
jgi:hypothetical protein